MSDVCEIQGLQIKDATARKNINILNSKTSIVIGDSYLCGQYVHDTPDYSDDNWGVFFKSLLGLSDKEFFSFGEGASGFTNKGNQNHTFLELLQANISSITNPENVKNIIVCGGCNDVNASTQETIETAIESFVTYCKTSFPNATVYIGMIGGYKMSNPTLPGRPKLKTMVYRAYLNCRKYGAVYLNGVEYVMQDYKNNYSSDGVHPSLNGQKEIAGAIYQALKTGSVKIVKLTSARTLTCDDLSSSSLVFSEKQENDKIICNLNGEMIFKSNITKGNKVINFGVLDLDYLRKTGVLNENSNFQNFNISARLTEGGYTNEILIDGAFYLSNTGEVKMTFDVPTHSYSLNRMILYNKQFIIHAMDF